MLLHPIEGVGFSANAYLVENNGMLLLVDAGIDAGPVISEARALLKGKSLDTLVLTHRHVDHTGGAASIVREFGCEVVVHALDARAIEEGETETTGADMFGVAIEPVPVRRVEHGDNIAGLTILHTPGHTSGSICLYDAFSGALFSGDTVFRDGVGRWDLPTGDCAMLRSSIESLSRMKITALYPGHGCWVADGGALCVRDGLRYLDAFGGY